MNTRELGEYILQTYNTKFFEDSMGGLNPLTPLGVPSCWTGNGEGVDADGGES